MDGNQGRQAEVQTEEGRLQSADQTGRATGRNRQRVDLQEVPEPPRSERIPGRRFVDDAQKLAEATSNTKWPEEGADPVVRGKGGGGVAEVAAKESTIGYSNLADARATFGAPMAEMFWAEIDHGSTKKGKKRFPRSPNRRATVRRQSKATPTVRNSPHGRHPQIPAGNDGKLWNEVTTSLSEPHYTSCGFSYDLSLTRFEWFGKAKPRKTKVREPPPTTCISSWKADRK